MAMKSHTRAAAWTAAAILTAIAGFQIYWGVGGTWGLDESSVTSASSTAADIGSVIIGLMALTVAGVLLLRVGYWRGHVPPATVWMTKTAALVSLGGAVAQYAQRGFAAGTINLIVALLAFVVSRSDLPAPPASDATPTPRGTPGSPAPTH
jgi:hypothetical protein